MPHIVVTHSSVNKLLLSLLLYLIPKCSLWNVSVLTFFPLCIFVLSDVMHSQDSGVICVQQLLIPTLLDLRLSLAHFLPSLLKCQASKIVLNSFIFCLHPHSAPFLLLFLHYVTLVAQNSSLASSSAATFLLSVHSVAF